ncbi:hypothetical protein M011DRAFT_267011 [Sporormia fimetaria CBS 119925]|uniref:Uncharacterized protein n=1 Tax=Sporormia fimetaria CBS 119925 TaxID=1340428 RepID=A0A6A6UZR4_9PLEO|nr:hypothetical protein M011DRAFT_267011 [Sporormia fimetaria CBS 119925]
MGGARAGLIVRQRHAGRVGGWVRGRVGVSRGRPACGLVLHVSAATSDVKEGFMMVRVVSDERSSVLVEHSAGVAEHASEDCQALEGY